MRISLVALLPIVLSLSSFVVAYEASRRQILFHIEGANLLSIQDPTLEAGELLEQAYFEKLERRELLSEFTTRELLAELVERAPKGGGGGKKSYSCPYCSKSYGQ
jgi:hypothetical protein